VTYHYDNSTCGTVENKKRTIKTDKPIALSFFSGAMGMDIGLEQAGFEVLLACEVDNACRKTITKNKPEKQVYLQLTI
jgi:DNA (cytosine-5)-methyltransferase 1